MESSNSDNMENINLKLNCDYEQEYPNPDHDINNLEYKRFAFVTVVMLGDLYVSAAIVLADSLRKSGSNADIVVLVTNDVSEEGKIILSKYFDRVIEVDYIRIPNWRSKIQKHRKYLDFVFTKFHCLELTEYEKVVLIDADAVMLKHPDHLFTLQAPAGVYLSNKDLFITYNNEGEYIAPKDGQVKWYKELCDCCGHGKLLPKHITDNVLKNRKNSGIAGGLMLLEPKKGELDNIRRDLAKQDSFRLVNKFFIWPEQQYLTQYYSGKWTSINPIYLGLQGYPHWKYLFGVQYAGDKPFVLKSKFPIEERMKYSDFVLWHFMFRDILENNPEFKNYKSIYQAVELNKYFKSKKMEVERENFAQLVSNIYNIPIHQIKHQTIKYYYLNSNMFFSPKWFNKTMFDIEKNNYQQLLNKLQKLESGTKSKYFKNLKIDNKLSLVNQSLEDIDKDNFASLYTSCRKNAFTMFLWEPAIKYIDDLTKFLDGDVYYVKKFTVSKTHLRNILFYIYTDFRINEIFSFIDKKLEYIKEDNDEIREFYFILFDNVNDKKLSGQGSKYKRDIRQFLLDKIKNKKNIYGNDLLHVSDHFYQAVEISQLLLNKNSMDILNNQRIDHFKNGQKSFLMLNTFRKYMYTNLTLSDSFKIVCFGGIILYILGLRETSDIDSITIDNKNNEFNNKIIKDFIDRSSKIKFIDSGIENKLNWKDSWTEKNNIIYREMDVDSYDTVCFNPRYHFYYMGIKIHTINFEITKKLIRLNRNDITDLFVISIYFKNNKVYFDKDNKLVLPKLSIDYDKLKKNFIVDMKKSLMKCYKINVDLDTIKKHISI